MHALSGYAYGDTVWWGSVDSFEGQVHLWSRSLSGAYSQVFI
jgi:hypothetical protein